MTAPAHVCCACDSLIMDPDDAVFVAYEPGLSGGPGWELWCHAGCKDDVEMFNPDLLRIMTRIWAAGS